MAVANQSCFTVSNTVNYVHSSLPFLTGLSEEATRKNLSTVAALSASPGYLGSLFDLYFRSLSWGFLVVLLFLVVIFITLLHLVCVYFCCFKKTDRDQQIVADEEKSCLKWSCGVFTIACGICSVAILCCGFWLEWTLNRVLLSHAPSSSFRTESIRHWLVVSVLVVAVFLVFITVVAFIVLLVRKWSKCFTVCLISLSLITALVSPLTGVGLSLLSFTSEFCEEFSELSNCSSPVTVAWSDICTKAFRDGFILVIVGCGLVLFISLGQCSGSVFTQLFLRHLKRTTRVDDSSDFLSGADNVMRSVSTGDPTAPPPMQRAATFVGDSHQPGANNYLTGDQPSSSNVPRRRQTMPAHAGSPNEPPPLYDDAWLSQSLQVTGREAGPASLDQATVRTSTPTGTDQIELHTPL